MWFLIMRDGLHGAARPGPQKTVMDRRDPLFTQVDGPTACTGRREQGGRKDGRRVELARYLAGAGRF